MSRNKAASISRLSINVLRLENIRGHLKWKVQELAEKSEISRSLVYEYLGSDKKEILVSALRFFLEEFYGLNQSDSSMTFSKKIQESRKKMAQFPEVVIFYQKWRSQPSWLNHEFEVIEDRFRKNLKKRFPHLKSVEVLALHALIHGLVTAPFLDADDSIEIFKYYWAELFSSKIKP